MLCLHFHNIYLNEQPLSKMKAVEVAGENICLVNVEGKYYAIGNICTHQGGPLTEGTVI